MRRLSFLVGKWNGEARLRRGPDEWVVLQQTEEAQYKLDGLLLVIAGVGRRESDGQLVLQALGILSFEEESGTYRLRAFNDGRFLETEVKLLDEGRAISWGFVLGQIATKSILRINERGEWTELAEYAVGSEPPTKL